MRHCKVFSVPKFGRYQICLNGKSCNFGIEFLLILALPGGDFNGAGTFFFPTIETPDGLIFGCLLSSDESELLSSLTD